MSTSRLNSIRIFAAWLIAFILMMILLALGHELMMVFITRTLGWDRYDSRFTYLVYYSLAGIVLILFFVLNYDYLSRMAKRGRLARSILRTLGMELAVVAAMQLALTLYGYYPLDALNLGLLVFGGGLAAGSLYLAARNKS